MLILMEISKTMVASVCEIGKVYHDKEDEKLY